METQGFKDSVSFNRGLVSNVPLNETDQVGNGIFDGKNVVPSPFGQPESWKGLSRRFGAAGKLMQIVGNKIATLDTGNAVLYANKRIYFVGSGTLYIDDPLTSIAQASSLIQIYTNSGVYQGGLPVPDAPTLEAATDANGSPITGEMTGAYSVEITRRRSATEGESPASPPSNVLELTGGRLRVPFPAALTSAGQDQWGVYFTRSTAGDVGPRYLLRYVDESEIESGASILLAQVAGNGATVNYSAGTSVSTLALGIALAIASSGMSAPTLRETNAFNVSSASAVTVNRPGSLVADDFIAVALFFKQIHTVTADQANVGTVTPTITGRWSESGNDFAPGSETVQIEALSTTQFRYKLASSGVWTTTNFNTAVTALGTTGLYIAWPANTIAANQTANKWTITPFAVTAPSGWTLHKAMSANDDECGGGVWGKTIQSIEPSSWQWSFNQATQVAVGMIAYTGVHATTPVSSSAASATTGTTHTVTFGGAPTTAQAVAAFFGCGHAASFTATAPLNELTSIDGSDRAMDFEFDDGELLDDIAPHNYDGPPACTHLFTVGPVLVAAGTFEGVGLTPSLPGQFELFDLSVTTFLNPSEPIVRIDQRPQDGRVIIWTRNSVQTVIPTGDDANPIEPRGLIPDLGIANANAACLTAHGAAFYSGKAGPVLWNAFEGPRTDFADPVRNVFERWNPDEVVVTGDAKGKIYIFCHRREAMAYYVDEKAWSTQLFFDDFLLFADSDIANVRIVSAIAHDSRVLFSIGNDALGYQRYEFNVGIGTDWRIKSVPRHGGATGFEKTIRAMRALGNLDTDQEMEWRDFVDTELLQGLLAPLGGGGYAASEILLSKRHADIGGIEWEFIVQSSRNNSGYLWAESSNFNPYGANALSTLSAATALFVVRFDGSGALQILKQNAAQAIPAAVQTGDEIRVTYDTAKHWHVSVIRNGVQVASTDYGVLSINANSLGIKALVGANARLDPGLVRIKEASAKAKLYRNFETSPKYQRTMHARGNSHYPWWKPDVRQAVTYEVEVAGRGSGQRVAGVLCTGIINPVEKA